MRVRRGSDGSDGSVGSVNGPETGDLNYPTPTPRVGHDTQHISTSTHIYQPGSHSCIVRSLDHSFCPDMWVSVEYNSDGRQCPCLLFSGVEITISDAGLLEPVWVNTRLTWISMYSSYIFTAGQIMSRATVGTLQCSVSFVWQCGEWESLGLSPVCSTTPPTLHPQSVGAEQWEESHVESSRRRHQPSTIMHLSLVTHKHSATFTFPPKRCQKQSMIFVTEVVKTFISGHL